MCSLFGKSVAWISSLYLVFYPPCSRYLSPFFLRNLQTLLCLDLHGRPQFAHTRRPFKALSRLEGSARIRVELVLYKCWNASRSSLNLTIRQIEKEPHGRIRIERSFIVMTKLSCDNHSPLDHDLLSYGESIPGLTGHVHWLTWPRVQDQDEFIALDVHNILSIASHISTKQEFNPVSPSDSYYSASVLL